MLLLPHLMSDDVVAQPLSSPHSHPNTHAMHRARASKQRGTSGTELDASLRDALSQRGRASAMYQCRILIFERVLAQAAGSLMS